MDHNRLFTSLCNPEAVRLATYNLKNLFLHDEGFEKPTHETRPLAKMIDQVAADLMVVQEAGSQRSLETLNARLEKEHGG